MQPKDRSPDSSDEASSCPTPAELMASPECSAWLRMSLANALTRDPVDAANDAELLARVLDAHARALLAVDAARHAAARGRPRL